MPLGRRKGLFPGTHGREWDLLMREEGNGGNRKDRREGTERQITELADTLIY